MTDQWYYVQKGNRHGPVAIEVIGAMFTSGELKSEDYVWKKGFENWKKIKDVSELESRSSSSVVTEIPVAAPSMTYKEVNLKKLKDEDRVIYVRIGIDRGGATNDYGPFNLKQLKQLFNENRINGKTLIFIQGTKEWRILGDLPEYQEVFHEAPPIIEELERRSAERRPFIARMFFQNNKSVYEGICRDISIGGMQILTDDFSGKEGDKVSINVHPENSDYHFTASGVVVRKLEGNSGFSFRFQSLSDEARRSIEKYLQEN